MPKRFLTLPVSWLSDPRRAAWVILGLLIALVFAIGFDGLLYNKHTKEQNAIQSLKDAKRLAAIAAHKACVANLPDNQALVGSLANYFDAQIESMQKLLHHTEKGTPLYKARLTSIQNAQTIYNVLEKHLPLKCGKVINT